MSIIFPWTCSAKQLNMSQYWPLPRAVLLLPLFLQLLLLLQLPAAAAAGPCSRTQARGPLAATSVHGGAAAAFCAVPRTIFNDWSLGDGCNGEPQFLVSSQRKEEKQKMQKSTLLPLASPPPPLSLSFSSDARRAHSARTT